MSESAGTAHHRGAQSGGVGKGPGVVSPRRIQLRRAKGWRKPPGAVVVARPSRWGNPYRVGDAVHIGPVYAGRDTVVRDNAHAVDLYRSWLFNQRRVEDLVPKLRGRDLCCWCRLDQPCHADVLLEYANPGWQRGSGPVTYEQITTYSFCSLPFDHSQAYNFTITVEWRGLDRWAIKWSSYVYGREGKWDFEMMPSSRSDEWIEDHRYSLDEARELARRLALDMKVNGCTVDAALRAFPHH